MELLNESGNLQCYLLESGQRAFRLSAVADYLGTTDTQIAPLRPLYVTNELEVEFVTEAHLPGLLIAILHNYPNKPPNQVEVERKAAKLISLLANWAFRLDVVVDNLSPELATVPLKGFPTRLLNLPQSVNNLVPEQVPEPTPPAATSAP